MQIIDEKYRLFGVINLIDLAVVLALLAGGFAVYKLLTPSAVPTAGSSNTKTIQYVFLCPQMRTFTPAQIKVGDQLYKTTGKAIGKVTAVKIVPTTGEVFDPGARKMVPYGSTVITDVYVTVVGQGQPTATGVVVSDLLLHANQPVPIMTSTFESDTALIADMKIAGE